MGLANSYPGDLMGRSVATQACVALSLMAVTASAGAQVTSGFGTRTDPFHGKAARHSGIDIASPTGTPIYATADAYVGRAQWVGNYGNLVELNHGGGYQTRYAHMHKILVRSGQFVRRGTVVGLVGSTGRSTGPHLHYEVRYNGKALDPTPYMRGGTRTTRSSATGGRIAVGGPDR